MEQRLFVVLLLLISACYPLHAEPTRDRAALLEFIAGTPHALRLQWTNATSACDWVGVICDANRTAVVALRLPGTGLAGSIPTGTLGRLIALRVLSLHSNRLSGSIPADFANLTLLRALYLYHNLFSGVIPVGLAQLDRLRRLDLSRNNLTGQVPFAFNNLTHLTGLLLQNNRLSGSLPSISIASLSDFNVSNNELNGSIPNSLERFPASSFAGNSGLCGGPLPPCNTSPSPSPASEQEPAKKSSKKLSTGAIIGIAVAGGVVLLILLLCCAFVRRRKRGRGGGGVKGLPKGADVPGGASRSGDTGMTSSSKEETSGGGGTPAGDQVEKKRLVFVQGGAYSYRFDLEDLLRASAEVLGKGSAGTSYKAVLEDGTTVAVKRLKDASVSKREFEAHMASMAVEHENLLPLRAFYYSKDERLLVFDYLPAGSLSSLLHGSRGSGRSPLDWGSRMRIAIAAGRGLAHLHTAAQIVHGNVRASNVILRADLDSCVLSHFCLYPLSAGNVDPPNRIAGYRAPELLAARRPTFQSDVYSFGVLLLELLTGKAPDQASQVGDDGVDLPRWVQSVVSEERTAEVFDAELMRYANNEEEMAELLQIAMACVAVVPDARPHLSEVVRVLEEIVSRPESNDEAVRLSPDDGFRAADDQAGGTSAAAATP